MKVSSARDLVAYWAESPPVHVLVRAAVGFEPKPSAASEMTIADVKDLGRLC